MREVFGTVEDLENGGVQGLAVGVGKTAETQNKQLYTLNPQPNRQGSVGFRGCTLDVPRLQTLLSRTLQGYTDMGVSETRGP